MVMYCSQCHFLVNKLSDGIYVTSVPPYIIVLNDEIIQKDAESVEEFCMYVLYDKCIKRKTLKGKRR